MAKQRRRSPSKAASAKSAAASATPPAKPGNPPLPIDPAEMIRDGNRPHETALQGTDLEDFGLDVLPVIQPHKA
jgi:hypothetical protein